MCFLLYAATTKALPRREWQLGSSDLRVESLSEQESPIGSHFSLPEVQEIGSTSNCGCDFPSIMFQNGGWPYFEDSEEDKEMVESDRVNREGLFNILNPCEEPAIELYGIWANDLDKPTEATEDIELKSILEPTFRFKERVLYRVNVS